VTPLPRALRTALSQALAERDLPADILRTRPVSGGCINQGTRLELTDGGAWFLKWNRQVPGDFFAPEVAGLQALRAAAGDAGEGARLRVPEPLAAGGGPETPAWLLLEWIEPGRAGRDHDEELGRGLARLHQAGADGPLFGWERDGWIGSLPQANDPAPAWADFWRDRRLEPQVRAARDAGRLPGGDGELLDRLLGAVERALPPEGDFGPHLLHGDLWGGNAYADTAGAPVLVDPAVYRGHAEVDLAMMELFGGFGAGVWDAYQEVRTIPEAYDAYRRDLYQLFYLLVHLNLFGASYLAGTTAAARRVLRAVG